jgi:oligopeptide/dipeptide ABC transporter ATP-binding protein
VTVTETATRAAAAGGTVLEVDRLRKHYPIRAGIMQRETGRVRAVEGVSFHIKRGETLALVGESGCGKTTVARCILRALKPTDGAIRFSPEPGKTVDLAPLRRRELRPLRRHIQMIFQDPYASLNPRMMVGDIIAEPLLVNGTGSAARQARVRELLELVGLPASARSRFPHAFSGGQRQRIGIARALALSPSLVIADEPVSALDVSVQAQIINLLLDLQDQLGLSMLFVAHDLGVVRHVSDRVAVMYVGRIVEVAETTALYTQPRHPYTAALLAAVPKADPSLRDTAAAPVGEVADPANPPPGCAFHPRCPFAVERCRTEVPELTEIASGNWAACHRAAELSLAGVA